MDRAWDIYVNGGGRRAELRAHHDPDIGSPVRHLHRDVTAPLAIAVDVEYPNHLHPFYTSISPTVTVTP